MPEPFKYFSSIFRTPRPESGSPRYLQSSGITKKISPHSLRHTFATYKAERGVSPYVLREWLGHARLDTTQIYVHMARENSKKGARQPHGAPLR